MIKVREPTAQVFNANKKGRDFVVGDIHGMYEDLVYELYKVNFDSETDRMFCVGDLIDRGPWSSKCLRLVKEPWFFSTYGNHEDLFLQAIAGKDHYTDLVWHQDGGEWAKSETRESLEELLTLAKKLPYFITINHSSGKKIGICHAQAPTNDWNDLDALTPTELQASIWGRTVAMGKAPIGYVVKNVDYTFHGHTPSLDAKPYRVSNCMFIDTGACFAKGKLTVINLDEWLKGEL